MNQLPKDHSIRKAFDMGRERTIGRAYNPMHEQERERSLNELLYAAYPGLTMRLLRLVRRIDKSVPW